MLGKTCAGVASVLLLLLSATQADAQSRAQTWDMYAGLDWSSSLTLDGTQGTGLDIDEDVGFNIGGSYNFTNRLAAGFNFGWLSPDYTATYLPESGPPFQSLRATMDVFSIAVNGTFNLLEGPITPFVEVGFGWTGVDSNVADGPPIAGCWWDPWWGYICAPFYSTYSENLTSWSGALGLRWDINPMWGLKASYGILQLDTSSQTENASLDMLKVNVIFRY
jgi:opacity protein-like surface antigen